ncbi:MAG: hypothetical protein WBA10_07215 [Elainellaceae cyanobacterium]
MITLDVELKAFGAVLFWDYCQDEAMEVPIVFYSSSAPNPNNWQNSAPILLSW